MFHPWNHQKMSLLSKGRRGNIEFFLLRPMHICAALGPCSKSSNVTYFMLTFVFMYFFSFGVLQTICHFILQFIWQCYKFSIFKGKLRCVCGGSKLHITLAPLWHLFNYILHQAPYYACICWIIFPVFAQLLMNQFHYNINTIC